MEKPNRYVRTGLLLLAPVLLLPALGVALPGVAARAGAHAGTEMQMEMEMPQLALLQGNSRLFSETGKTVKGRFLDYWNQNGGLAQQGFPISEEIQERSDTDGKVYTVQYFERAVFELHPENRAPNDVLLSLLGNFLYKQKYPNGAPGQSANNSPGSRLFPETGKRVGGRFLEYWQQNGGLAQQGFPISDEFNEKSDLDGKTYKVQYFERAVFELHPENKPPYDVLLSQLGTFRYKTKYLQARAAATSTTAPRSAATPTSGSSGTQEIAISMREWAVAPAQIEAKAGKIRFVVTNEGRNMHNFSVRNDAGDTLGATPNFSGGADRELELTLQPGTYTMFCSLPGHEQSGQKGTLVVK